MYVWDVWDVCRYDTLQPALATLKIATEPEKIKMTSRKVNQITVAIQHALMYVLCHSTSILFSSVCNASFHSLDPFISSMYSY